MNYGNLTENKGIEIGSAAHRRAWESGHIDYFGRDSFANIEQQLQRNMEQNSLPSRLTPPRQSSSPPKTTSILKSSTNGTTSHSEDLMNKSIPIKPNSHSEDLSKATTLTKPVSQPVTSSQSKQPPTEQIITTRTTAVVNTVLNDVGRITKDEQSIRHVEDGGSTKVLRQNIIQLPTTTTIQSIDQLSPTILKESTAFSQRQNTQFVSFLLRLTSLFSLP